MSLYGRTRLHVTWDVCQHIPYTTSISYTLTTTLLLHVNTPGLLSNTWPEETDIYVACLNNRYHRTSLMKHLTHLWLCECCQWLHVTHVQLHASHTVTHSEEQALTTPTQLTTRPNSNYILIRLPRWKEQDLALHWECTRINVSLNTCSNNHIPWLYWWT